MDSLLNKLYVNNNSPRQCRNGAQITLRVNIINDYFNTGKGESWWNGNNGKPKGHCIAAPQHQFVGSCVRKYRTYFRFDDRITVSVPLILMAGTRHDDGLLNYHCLVLFSSPIPETHITFCDAVAFCMFVCSTNMTYKLHIKIQMGNSLCRSLALFVSVLILRSGGRSLHPHVIYEKSVTSLE